MSSGIEEPKSHESSTKQAGGISRAKLMQRLQSRAANLPEFVHDLVTAQAVHVAGTEAAGFLLEKTNETQFSLRPIAHIRPDESDAQTRAAAITAFQEFIQPCIERDQDGAIVVAEDGPEPQYCLVTLLRSEGQTVAASAVITRCRDQERAFQRLVSMQLVAGYFDLYTLRRNSDSTKQIAQSHQHVLQLSTAVATAEGFKSAAMNLCNELATRTGAVRVSIGWLKGDKIKVVALSNTEEFDRRQELIVQLERTMEECLDQEEMVQFDAEGARSENVTREAQSLSRSQGGNSVISLPLRRQSEIVGVVTCEFGPDQHIVPQASAALGVAVDLLAPQLYDRYQNDRWLITKTGISIRETTKLAIGPKHMLAKLIIAIVLGAGIFVTLYRPMYRVKANFSFIPLEKYTLSAPFEGKIADVFIEPGQKVKKGEVLVKMDTMQLQDQLFQAQGEERAAQAEYEAYLSDAANASKAKIALANKEKAHANVELYTKRIGDAEIKSPIDGEIFVGELKDKRGSTVKLGETLVEVGQRDKLRAELHVAERDIQDVKEGLTGKLATTAMPYDKRDFVIERVNPAGLAKEGDNVFQVFATLKDPAPDWLPLQEGDARIDIAKKPLVWQWTHRLVEFVRLKLWI